MTKLKRPPAKQYISATEFRAKCLQLMDEVQRTGKEIVVTKLGKPVARILPPEEEKKRPIFGWMKGKGEILVDIVGPTGEKWEADEQPLSK
jgi:prevent-host-death family protein